MDFQKVINILKAILSSIVFLGPDSAKTRLNYFFDKWCEEDENFFESFKAVYVNCHLLQSLFDEKDLDFPATESMVLKQNGFWDKLTEEQAQVLVDYFRSEDFKNHLTKI